MIYINTQGGHYKFWGYTINELVDYSKMDGFTNIFPKMWQVTTYWGKIGMDLETCPRKEFDFNSNWEARRFVEDKLREKRNKGYEPLKESYRELLKGGNVKNSQDTFVIGLNELSKMVDLF